MERLKCDVVPVSELDKWDNWSPEFHLKILPFMKKLGEKSKVISEALNSHNSSEVTRLYNLYQKHLKLQEEIKRLKREMGL